jgi:hypothetical protein
MNRNIVERIADAVLYEGYILYPYRPSIKNRQRWTFGGLFPETYCQNHSDESCFNRTECLLRCDESASLDVTLRFLHLIDRQIADANGHPVEQLQVGNDVYQSWQEAEDRSVDWRELKLKDLLWRPHHHHFEFMGWSSQANIADGEGSLARTQQTLRGVIVVGAAPLRDQLIRLSIEIRNETNWVGDSGTRRDEAALYSMASAHTIARVASGEFVSMTDPPEDCRGEATACRNVRLWPVLVGDEDQKDTILSSPIILGDYPRVAEQSPGDFFDGAEIDEMLTLRVLTLTDDEKRATAAIDTRARELLTRTESMAPDVIGRLHGAIHDVRNE